MTEAFIFLKLFCYVVNQKSVFNTKQTLTFLLSVYSQFVGNGPAPLQTEIQAFMGIDDA